jgi:hypothetical protein
VVRDLVQRLRDPARQRNAARTDADKRDIFDPGVAFENFVRDSRERASHPARIENDSQFTPLCTLTGAR